MPAGYKTHDPTRWADKHHAGMMFCGFLPGVDHTNLTIRLCLDAAGATVVRFMPEIACARISVPEENEQTLAAALAATGLIRYVEPIFAQSKWAATTPNDPDISSEWHLTSMGCFDAWDYTTGNSSLVVGHCDSGINLTHADVCATIDSPWNWNTLTTNVQDGYGHGTETSGCICANTNNSVGVAGVAWGCAISPQVVDIGGTQIDVFLTEAVVALGTAGVSVITMSFASYGFSQAEQDACTYAFNKGAILFAAGDNQGFSFPSYPALYNNVYAICSVNSSYALSGFNNYGAKFLLAAPGESIFTTVGSGYGAVSGTSFATPIAAGVAALVRSVNPGLGPVETGTIMQATADAISFNANFPNLAGVVNAKNAVIAAQHRLSSSFWMK